MKNKLILLLCAVVVLMLCACDSGSVKNSSLNIGNDTDTVTVSLAVASEGSSEKAISIDNPVFDSDIIFQYKAIPGFKLANGKTPVGATGDVWTDFPSSFNGSSFELTISKGDWTFDVRGVDKNDTSIVLYKLPAMMSFSFSSKSTRTIVFNIEKISEGFGIACLNILVQTDIEDGSLVVEYSPVGSDDSYKCTFKKPTAIDKYKAFFIDTLGLASGNYIMTFHYEDGKYKANLGPYIVEIADKKDTVVEGRIAHQSNFATYFSTPKEEFKYRATFFGTAVAEVQLKPAVNNIKEQAEKKQLIVNNEVKKAVNNEVKQLNNVQKEKQVVKQVPGNINLALAVVGEEQVKEQAAKAVGQKKIGIVRELICYGEVFDLDSYSLYQENGTLYYSIPEQLFKDIAEKHKKDYSPEHVISLRVTWTNDKKTLIAESEPVSILYIH